MPIHVDEMDAQVEVQHPDGAPPPAASPSPGAAQQRWDEQDRRAAELRERTAAWGFDD